MLSFSLEVLDVTTTKKKEESHIANVNQWLWLYSLIGVMAVKRREFCLYQAWVKSLTKIASIRSYMDWVSLSVLWFNPMLSIIMAGLIAEFCLHKSTKTHYFTKKRSKVWLFLTKSWGISRELADTFSQYIQVSVLSRRPPKT